MILHLDMDAFFASIEQMDNPDLRGRPVIVGGRTRGVVATASYEARVFGIHSAMPIATAMRLCPQATIVPARGRRYSEISASLMACLREWSPVVQAASIDEAYLDISRFAGEELADLAEAIKGGVAKATGGLTCSIGIAPVKFLAKICSDLDKPDGLYVLEQSEVDDFLLGLPLAKLPGVGKSMLASLHSFGITDMRRLRGLSRDFLEQRYGKWGIALHERSRGIDRRTVHENLPAKSESAEGTFAVDVHDRETLRAALLAHAEKVSERLKRNCLAGRTITVKIRFSDFRIITRSRSLPFQTDAAHEIHEVACAILGGEALPLPVRLIGLGVSGFDCRTSQLPLPGLDNIRG